jgi:hypothetical protein
MMQKGLQSAAAPAAQWTSSALRHTKRASQRTTPRNSTMPWTFVSKYSNWEKMLKVII